MIGIIGSGGWGTALAKVCADKGHQVYIWALEPEVVMEINQQHTNHTFLPGVELPETIHASNSIGEVVSGKKFIFTAV